MTTCKAGIRGICKAAAAALILTMGAVAFEAHAAPHVAAAANAAEPQTPVDINKASADDLTAVPGIGDSIARRIVEFREKNGPFKTVDDLLKIQGIGEKSLQKLRPHLTVDKTH